MADPKSIFNATNNRGLATIIDQSGTLQQLDNMDKMAAWRAKLAQEARKEKIEQADKFKDFESWRYYTPALSEQYRSILNDLKDDKIDFLTAKGRMADYADKARATMQMQNEFKEAQADWTKNEKVVDPQTWYLSKYHNDASIDGLKQAASQQPNRYGFLDEQGGSAYVNTTAAFKDVLNKSLDGWVEKEIATQGKSSVAARGLLQFMKQKDESKLRSYTEVDPKTGEIRVLGIDQLIDGGVLNLFESDPYTNRVLEDRALQLKEQAGSAAKDTPIENYKTIALREILKPYGSQGTVSSERAIDFQSYSPMPVSGGGSGSGSSGPSAEARRLYDVFKSRGAGKGFTETETKTYTDAYMKKMGITGSSANALRGKQFFESTELAGLKLKDGTKLGRLVYRPGEGRRTARVEVISMTKDASGATVEKRNWRELSLSELQKSLPVNVYNEIEGLARSEGRIDPQGNFIFDMDITQFND